MTREDLFSRQRQPFAIAGILLAILTALLCALMPVELPAPDAPGSAFNPANSYVTLNAPASTRSAIKRLAQGNGSDSGTLAVLPALAGFDAPHLREALAFARVAPTANLPAAPPGAALPRGPPLA